MKAITLSISKRKSAENLAKVLSIASAVVYMDEALDTVLSKHALALTKDNVYPAALGFVRPWEALITAFTDRNTTKLRKALDTIALKLKEKREVIRKEIDISQDLIKLLGNVVSISGSQSHSAMLSMAGLILKMGDPLVARLFTITDVVDQREVDAQLSKFTQKVWKKAPDAITLEDKEGLRAKDPEGYKTFLRLNRERGQAVKDFVRNAVLTEAATGEHLMAPVQKIVRMLNDNKIAHKIPTFKGFIGPNMELYTSERKKLNGNVTGRVELNPEYDPKKDNTFVFLHYPLFGKGDPQRIYTVDFKQGTTAKKFGVVGSLVSVIDEVRAKWLKDLKGDIKLESTVCALILEIIYITSARIGSTRGATGISSLLVKEFSTRAASSFSLIYTGKKGIKQKHVIPRNTVVTKHLFALLEKLSIGKKPNDLLMTYGNGRPVTGTKVNNYLRSLGVPEGVTVHKFRHARGTSLAKKVLDKHPFGKGTKVTDAAANKWILEALKKVGTELGHMNGDKVTATTAIQNYIDPSILKDWFESLGVRPNNAIQAAINKAGKAVEE
jgi:hypothetical protein